MNIGIVCEGPTDYILLKAITDHITKEENHFNALQPEQDLCGRYGNGWKGVWKWCTDNAEQKEKLMKEISPGLDLLIVQMDGDVSRKEKIAHCWCDSTLCDKKYIENPIKCDEEKILREQCPIVLPCASHRKCAEGYRKHLENLIEKCLVNIEDTCMVIPCDSTESWIVAAYDEIEQVEEIKNPWENVIAKKKYYHDIRVRKEKKSTIIFKEFANEVCRNWGKVTELCISARIFEENLLHMKRGQEA